MKIATIPAMKNIEKKGVPDIFGEVINA